MPKRKASSGASSLDAGGKQPVPVQKLVYRIRSDSTKEAVDWMGSVFRHHTQTVSTTASTTATASTTPTTTSSSPLHLPNAAFGGFVDMTTTTSSNKLDSKHLVFCVDTGALIWKTSTAKANTLSLSRKSTQIAQEVEGVRQEQLRDTQNQFSSDHPCVTEILGQPWPLKNCTSSSLHGRSSPATVLRAALPLPAALAARLTDEQQQQTFAPSRNAGNTINVEKELQGRSRKKRRKTEALQNALEGRSGCVPGQTLFTVAAGANVGILRVDKGGVARTITFANLDPIYHNWYNICANWCHGMGLTGDESLAAYTQRLKRSDSDAMDFDALQKFNAAIKALRNCSTLSDLEFYKVEILKIPHDAHATGMFGYGRDENGMLAGFIQNQDFKNHGLCHRSGLALVSSWKPPILGNALKNLEVKIFTMTNRDIKVKRVALAKAWQDEQNDLW